MPQQNRLLVPITLVLAVLVVGGLGYVVLKGGNTETTSPASNAGGASSSTTKVATAPAGAGLVGPPITIDSTTVQVLVAKSPVAKGTTLDAAMTDVSIDFTLAVAGQVPQDALTRESNPGPIAIADIPQGAILTTAMFGAAVAPPPTTVAPVPCPADVVVAPAADSVVGIRVKGAVSRGMSGGAAAAAGLLEFVSVHQEYAPFTIVATLSSICTGAAQFDLAPGTLLVTGLFA